MMPRMVSAGFESCGSTASLSESVPALACRHELVRGLRRATPPLAYCRRDALATSGGRVSQNNGTTATSPLPTTPASGHGRGDPESSSVGLGDLRRAPITMPKIARIAWPRPLSMPDEALRPSRRAHPVSPLPAIWGVAVALRRVVRGHPVGD